MLLSNNIWDYKLYKFLTDRARGFIVPRVIRKDFPGKNTFAGRRLKQIILLQGSIACQSEMYSTT